MDKVEAMRKAAPIRMRPVLMTAISMIFGVVPAAFGFGPGSETRAPMAVASGAGMFSSTLLTLLVVPVFYLMLDDLAERVRARLRRRARARGGGRAARRSRAERRRAGPRAPSAPLASCRGARRRSCSAAGRAPPCIAVQAPLSAHRSPARRLL